MVKKQKRPDGEFIHVRLSKPAMEKIREIKSRFALPTLGATISFIILKGNKL